MTPRKTVESIVSKDNLLGFNPHGKKFYLTVREITGKELYDLLQMFTIIHMIGENDTYGDILITMTKKITDKKN